MIFFDVAWQGQQNLTPRMRFCTINTWFFFDTCILNHASNIIAKFKRQRSLHILPKKLVAI